MAKEVTLFKSKEPKSRADVSTFLHDLADKIAEGQVTLSRGQKSLPLDLPETIILEVEVEEEHKRRKGKEYSFELELKWYDDMEQLSTLVLK